ncbi:MAG: hypothetical protein L6R42_006629 [Xanthoria sp. 1 TBL-2021]|nr:MAG: hypothetical protein L6R42_006629 [Xanthoria sp. 1 TBL-2021]
MHGGCVCMPSEFQRKKEVVSVINDMKVNWADITPSFSNTFAGRALCGHGPAHQLLRTAGMRRMYGQSDTQIKIRGQRVKLGETENQLTKYYAGAATSMLAFPQTGKYADQHVAVVERCDEAASHENNRLLAGLGASDTRIALMGSQEQSQYPFPPSNALAHEIGIKVAELLLLRNYNRLISLIGYDFRLAAFGFDSIQAITLRMWLKKQFDANIPVPKLTLDTITICGLADLINHPLESVPTVKLLQEIETMLVAGAKELNAHNDTEPNNFIYLSDIETVTRSTINAAIIERSHHPAEKDKVIKILDGITLADFWQVVREAEYPLRPIPSEQWWTAMRENVQRRGESIVSGR